MLAPMHPSHDVRVMALADDAGHRYAESAEQRHFESG
jgi:hypothetical protein